MRRARLTFEGAFHHCVNRGHGRDRILAGDKDKEVFLNILAEASQPHVDQLARDYFF